ncbi:hypothetical protein A2U01_0081784, partial [Trifolium medium]|nr:hypothetical protein [Trifolium medium]
MSKLHSSLAFVAVEEVIMVEIMVAV